MKKRSILLIFLLLAALIAGTIYLLPTLMKTPEETNTKTSTTTTNSQTTLPEKNKTNKPQVFPETPILVPDEMQAVINENAEFLYKDTSQQLASAFPIQMVPLYGVSGIADSYGITNDKGKPGWNTSYVSNDPTTDLVGFYRALLETASGFTESTASESTSLKANVSGYAVTVTISPNNPQKTDLQGNSAVSIFIEEL
ncbi:MAG: hypothetical protein ACRCU3_00565 [Eubacteriaceae bacterium]